MVTVRRRNRPLRELNHRLVSEIAYLYVKTDWGAVEIAKYLEKAYPYEYEVFHLSNEVIRKVLRLAIDRGVLRLMPCDDDNFSRLIRERCQTAFTAANPGLSCYDKRIMKAVRVLNVGGPIMRPPATGSVPNKLTSTGPVHGAREFETSPVVELIADAAAEELLELIYRVGHNGKRVHIGLGAGNTSQCVVRRLGKLVQRASSCPPLTLHALTPGFSVDPLKSPVTYFRFFEKSGVDIEYVGFSAAPIVDVADLPKLRQEPGYVNAAEQAQDIDIVITSLARAGDPHGMLERYLKEHYRGTYDQLRKKSWKGDVQFCPFSDEPLELKQGVRAVSLLGLRDLKAMVDQPNKYVLLVAGPCNACGERKTEAIAPLLVEPSLNVWTHMVMDVETAASLTTKSNDDGHPLAEAEAANRHDAHEQPEIESPPPQDPAPKRPRSGGGRKKRPPK
jgi:hypothetical protein